MSCEVPDHERDFLFSLLREQVLPDLVLLAWMLSEPFIDSSFQDLLIVAFGASASRACVLDPRQPSGPVPDLQRQEEHLQEVLKGGVFSAAESIDSAQNHSIRLSDSIRIQKSLD